MSWKSIILRRCLKLAEETPCVPPHMIQACIDVNSSKRRYSVTSRKETKAGWHCYEEGQNVGRRTRESRKSIESQLFSSYNSATGFSFPRVWWISAYKWNWQRKCEPAQPMASERRANCGEGRWDAQAAAGQVFEWLLICCELIIPKWFCLLRVKWCFIRWAEKAVDKNDHREAIWSGHTEKNFTP